MTKEQLKKLFHYDPVTGIFTRLKTTCSTAIKGNVVGSNDGAGYLKVQIGKNKHRLHRLAFLYMDEPMPEQVDHINHVRDDNRWCNLRSANDSVNSQNRSMNVSNKSKFNGVDFHKRENKWRARICVDFNSIHLGDFVNKIDAINARKKADLKYKFHPNHGV